MKINESDRLVALTDVTETSALLMEVFTSRSVYVNQPLGSPTRGPVLLRGSVSPTRSRRSMASGRSSTGASSPWVRQGNERRGRLALIVSITAITSGIHLQQAHADDVGNDFTRNSQRRRVEVKVDSRPDAIYVQIQVRQAAPASRSPARLRSARAQRP